MSRVKEVAAAIDAHLKRMEADPAINTRTRYYDGSEGHPRFYKASAYQTGRYVQVTYISFHLKYNLQLAEAEAYLKALDAGSTDRHWEEACAAEQAAP